jgi:hypothetical protein
MSRRAALLLIGGLVLLAVLSLVWRACSGGSTDEIVVEGGIESDAPAGPDSTRSALLYFPGAGSKLHGEERELPELEEIEGRVRSLVTGVIEGPRSDNLMPAFPPELEIGKILLADDGLVYVDLLSAAAAPPASGSADEMLSVYSLVNTVMLDLAEIEGVVLLWNGQQRPTFAGHLDTSRPLRPKRDLMADESGTLA